MNYTIIKTRLNHYWCVVSPSGLPYERYNTKEEAQKVADELNA